METDAPRGDKQPEDDASSSAIIPPPKCEVTVNSAGRKVIRKIVYKKVMRVRTKQKILCADGTVKYNTVYTTRPVDDGRAHPASPSEGTDTHGSVMSAEDNDAPRDAEPHDAKRSSAPIQNVEEFRKPNSDKPARTGPQKDESFAVLPATDPPHAPDSSAPMQNAKRPRTFASRASKKKVLRMTNSQRIAKAEQAEAASFDGPETTASVSDAPGETTQPDGSSSVLDTVLSADDTSDEEQSDEPDSDENDTSVPANYRWWESAQHSLKGGPVFTSRCKPFTAKDVDDNRRKLKTTRRSAGPAGELDAKDPKTSQDAGGEEDSSEESQEDDEQPAENQQPNIAAEAPTEDTGSRSTTRKSRHPRKRAAATMSDVDEKDHTPTKKRKKQTVSVPYTRLAVRMQKYIEEKKKLAKKEALQHNGQQSVCHMEMMAQDGENEFDANGRERYLDYATMRSFNQGVFPYLYTQNVETGAFTCVEQPDEVAHLTDEQWDSMHEPSELSACGWRRVPIIGETAFGKHVYQWKKLKNIK